MGEPRSSSACAVSAALDTSRQSGVGRPSKRQMRLVMILSMAMADAITPGPV